MCKKCNSLYRSFEERDGENFKRSCSHTSHHAIPTEPTLPNSTSTHYHHNSHVSFFFSLFNSILFSLLGWFCLCSESSAQLIYAYVSIFHFPPLSRSGSCSVRNTLKTLFSPWTFHSLYMFYSQKIQPNSSQPNGNTAAAQSKVNRSILSFFPHPSDLAWQSTKYNQRNREFGSSTA